MTDPRKPDPAVDETSEWRARWESAQETLRTHLEEPVEKATRITRRTLAWFPIRVWRHYLRHNGFLLAAGVSYQALFAIFGVIYLAFAIVGLWLGASRAAIEGLISIINDYIPNLISEQGLVTPEQVEAVATSSASTLSITGAIALVIVVWTAIGFITFARRAVRDIFGLPFDTRSYFLLKARDLVAAVIFGVALLTGALVGSIATWALGLLFTVFGLEDLSALSNAVARVASLLVSFAINGAALAGMFRFLTGAALPWRRIWPGSLLGGAAIVVLQVGAGLLLSYTPSNPLLATFAVLIGFLLWFRLNSIVILVAGSWIAVAASDRNLAIAEQSEDERARAEYDALLLAAEVRLREARLERDEAPWYRAWAAARRLRQAEDDLARIREIPPPPVRSGGVFDF
ncbi:MAG: ribonuclease BN [Microbacterium sp.]|uniref:YihY/virulence factor BrkB family protein n=1 Tax=Microbacterium sp. TaxID=51671 RepID=UPI000DB552F4|nr:YihY/virulence factor BrkB family protein [Microbacterium sp.]PZU39394.1 MAG: ribonuclease BN [Microbacterium sp.]